MAFELPNLPYATDALEPHDKQTMKSIMTNTTTRMLPN